MGQRDLSQHGGVDDAYNYASLVVRAQVINNAIMRWSVNGIQKIGTNMDMRADSVWHWGTAINHDNNII